MKKVYERKYSGPGRSGMCLCGHRWDVHHIGVTMNRAYYDSTGEEYLPWECDANECECRQYNDSRR